MKLAKRNVEELTHRCAEARRGNDPEFLNRIVEANSMDYSNEAVSTLDAQVASDLRDIKARMDRIDSNTKDLRDWQVFNPYKGK